MQHLAAEELLLGGRRNLLLWRLLWRRLARGASILGHVHDRVERGEEEEDCIRGEELLDAERLRSRLQTCIFCFWLVVVSDCRGSATEMDSIEDLPS